MKRHSLIFALTVGLLIYASSSSATDEASARYKSAKGRTLEVRVGGGRVFVTGTDGDEVRARAERMHAKGAEPASTSKAKQDDPRASGLRRLSNTDTGLEIWAEDNDIGIGTAQFATDVDLFVDVPRNVQVTISGQFTDSVLVRDISEGVRVRVDGAVRLERIVGDVEVKTGSGWIYLVDVSGGIVANSQFAGIEATLSPSDPDKPISLIATGHIDVALPQKTAATLVMKSSFGELFTDFDLKMQPKKASREDAPVVYTVPDRANSKGYVYVYKSDREDESDGVDEDSTRSRERAPLPDPPSVYAPGASETILMQPGARGVIVVPPDAPLAPLAYGATRVAKLNGGGVEIRMTTMSGNIYIRKR